MNILYTKVAGVGRAALALLPMALLSCDLAVTNPGPVADEFLDDPLALPALVGGMMRSIAVSQSLLAWQGSTNAKELIAVGGIGYPGFIAEQRFDGVMDADNNHMSTVWNAAQKARFVAEDGLRRMRDGLEGFASSALAAEALAWAGHANRLLGENMCFAVIDGGAAEPRQVHLTRAEGQFTEALTIATAAQDVDLQHRALAGRASVRLGLEKWSEAEQDAQGVPQGFLFELGRSGEHITTLNRFTEANAASPWRTTSVYTTYFEDYFDTTADPRTPWDCPALASVFTTNHVCDINDSSAPSGEGALNLPWFYELKYKPDLEAPMIFSSYHEMQLIIAEAQLRAGNWAGALAIINVRRGQLGVPLRTASTAEEAWTALKLERFIELWLEGRALGDHHRYLDDSTPGPLPSELDTVGAGWDYCFPIPRGEEITNPNISFP